MAFWGTEIKPGRPFTLSNKYGRRLRISQATLGIGDATANTTLQCNVGDKSPVMLCVLQPNRTESLHLAFEFEETDDVVFSVIGPRSIFLAGYFVRQTHHDADDTESFGVDIQNSENDQSSHGSEDDENNDSFINDDDHLEFIPESPTPSAKEMEDIASENDKPKVGEQRKRKYRIIESDSDDKSLDFDKDEVVRSGMKTTIADVEEQNAHEEEKALFQASPIPSAKEERNVEAEIEQEKTTGDEAKDDLTNPLDLNDQPDRDLSFVKELCKSILADSRTPVEHEELHEEQQLDRETKLSMNQEDKEEETEEKDEENIILKEVHRVEENIINNEDLNKDMDITTDQKLTPNNDQVQTQIIGLETKLSMDGEGTEGKESDVPMEAQFVDENNGLTNSDDIAINQKLPLDDEKDQRIVFEETIKKRKRSVEDVKEEKEHTIEQSLDTNISIKLESVASANESKKKSKKRKKRTQGEDDLNMNMPEMTNSQTRTLPNGLIIEELTSGQQNGKVATPGKKVKIYYTGMLKDNERVFDTNVGKTAFKFQLGDEKYIDGWNVGIDGMRVGEKRRLIIPPHMAFGDHGLEDIVPPNSWLVYDIELVSVRR